MKAAENSANRAVFSILTRDTGSGAVPASRFAPEVGAKVVTNAANHAVSGSLTRDTGSASAPASRVRVMGWRGGEEGEGCGDMEEGVGTGNWGQGRFASRSGLGSWGCQDM